MSFNINSGLQSFTATASQTDFDFNFKIFEDTDISVYQTPTGQDPDDTADILIITTDYTVTIDGDNGGTISLVTGASSGDTIVIQRSLPVTRSTSYVTNGDLLADTLNDDQEYQTYMIQDGFTASDNQSVKLSKTDVGVSPLLPGVVANMALMVKSDSSGLEWRAIDDTGAVQEAWEAEAEAKTSLSYAIQPEDENVIEYTSNGDGSFTETTTANYSSLHWAAKAYSVDPSDYALLAGATFTGQAKGITPVSAEDFTRKDYVDTADALKAPLASPALTGTPTAPTATATDDSTQIATTAFVRDKLAEYDSGWQTMYADNNYTLTHNLGTADVHYTLYIKVGTEVTQMNPALTYPYSDVNKPSGLTAIITSTTFKIRTGRGLLFYRRQEDWQTGDSMSFYYYGNDPVEIRVIAYKW